MLMTFVIVIMFVGLGILLGMYSVFFPFFENIKDISNYNKAYYGAVSALERAVLITKYQKPGFEGSGGWYKSFNYGNITDYNTGDDLGILNLKSNGVLRNIKSRTKKIPSTGNSNIDLYFSDENFTGYNKLGYNLVEKILFDIDTTSNENNYYIDDGNIENYNGSSVLGYFRLPIVVYSGFGGNESDSLLCDWENENICDYNKDNLYDEIVAYWTWEGIYKSGSEQIKFSIIPHTQVDLEPDLKSPIDNLDTNLRESVINNSSTSPKLEFSNPMFNNFHPLKETIFISTLSGHNIITDDENIGNKNYYNIFQNSTGLSLNLGLGNLMFARNGNIYPFLEYKLEFNDYVSDRYYNIKAIGLVGEYKVDLIVKKSSVKKSSVGNFTIIF